MNFLASPPLEWWRMRWRAPCTSICCTIHWARTATESGVPARDLAIPGRIAAVANVHLRADMVSKVYADVGAPQQS